ncbi:hypothetical protein [Bifidobacterium jacchi]|uniref:ABC transporter permease n=1 Tax=Bifidobacterium jacchi TaxID=2490545 RepID=A0A5N5RKX1_9BIFI|nr:hypothetical protein [Bifidobacterium jacchi]KAB5607947.1 hypothetical protein EHS19_03205 [Bifidobacterium jacchi]
MRLASICSEALRNIGSGTSRAVTMLIAVLFAGTLLGGYEAVSVVALENEAAARITAYADTKVVVGSNVSIDGKVCDRLSSVPGGPERSGAVRRADAIAPKSTPTRDVSTYEITPGMIGMLIAGGNGVVDGVGVVDDAAAASGSAQSGDAVGDAAGTPTKPRIAASSRIDTSGIWVSRELAADFGLTVGTRFETTTGTTTVAGVFDWPNDGRDTRFAYAMLVPASPSQGVFEECWAKQWPTTAQTDELLYSTVVASNDSEPGAAGVTEINKSFDSRYDAQVAYAGRMTRWMPYVALAVGLLLGLIAVRRRRLEYAGALHSGQSKGAQLLGIALETLIWAGLGALCSGSLLTTYGVRAARSDVLAVLIAAWRSPLALFAGAMVAALAAGSLIRESQLFRYFKNR